MEFIYNQVGFKDDEKTRLNVHYTVTQILWRLRNYNDNGPIPMYGPLRFIPVADSDSGRKIKEVLDVLVKYKILQLRHIDESPVLLFEIFVSNRYKLDLLLAETKWIGEEKEERSVVPKIDNLVYYDLKSGRGLVNGNAIFLKGRNKKLFKHLFEASPGPVNRDSLLGAAMIAHKDDDKKYAINDAFSALRSACKVDKSVISLSGNVGRLNAKVFPLSVQIFEDTFGTNEKQ